jgi:hypothetical protein
MGSAFDINVINENSIKNMYIKDIYAGFCFDIRFPAYRGSALSCIQRFDVILDSEHIEANSISFCLNGKKFLLKELPELYAEYWFIRDSAEIQILTDRELSGEHHIQVDYEFRIPYTGYFGNYMIAEGRGDRIVCL